jgi:hypothetical protein
MTNSQAHKYKVSIGAEVLESSTDMMGNRVWLFYSSDGRKLGVKPAK